MYIYRVLFHSNTHTEWEGSSLIGVVGITCSCPSWLRRASTSVLSHWCCEQMKDILKMCEMHTFRKKDFITPTTSFSRTLISWILLPSRSIAMPAAISAIWNTSLCCFFLSLRSRIFNVNAVARRRGILCHLFCKSEINIDMTCTYGDTKGSARKAFICVPCAVNVCHVWNWRWQNGFVMEGMTFDNGVTQQPRQRSLIGRISRFHIRTIRRTTHCAVFSYLPHVKFTAHRAIRVPRKRAS